jgi:cysteine synthase B
VEIHAKAEWENPGGSVKDRAALGIVRDAEARGVLAPGITILDASSGNTGIAYAMIGRELGYAVHIVLPGNVSPSRLRLLEHYGAQVTLTDPQEGMDGAIEAARSLHADAPERFFYADQYSNPANWRMHARTTGPEILAQTGGRITHFVAGLGTTGTFTGVGRFLRGRVPDVFLAGVQPDTPLHGLEGLKHLETTRHVPPIYDADLADTLLVVSTEEAQTVARILEADQGLRVGPSAAAAAAAARRLASTLDRGVAVTVFPDDAAKYEDEPFWRKG